MTHRERLKTVPEQRSSRLFAASRLAVFYGVIGLDRFGWPDHSVFLF